MTTTPLRLRRASEHASTLYHVRDPVPHITGWLTTDPQRWVEVLTYATLAKETGGGTYLRPNLPIASHFSQVEKRWVRRGPRRAARQKPYSRLS